MKSKNSKSKSLTKKLLRYLIPFVFLSIFFIVVGLPLIYAALWSTVNPDYPWSYPDSFPKNISLYQWNYVFQKTSIIRCIGNSLLIAIVTTIVSFFLSFPTAYALGRRPLKGVEFFKIIILFPMVMPIMAMSLFLGRILFTMGLSGTYQGVIIAHILLSMPYMLRILIVNFESIPQDLIDAASNLGGGFRSIFSEVFVPMILPGLIAGSIFTFIISIEEFNFSFIIGAPDIQTIPTLLFTYLGDQFIRTRASVVALILLIPNFTFLLITERFIKTEYMGAALGKM